MKYFKFVFIITAILTGSINLIPNLADRSDISTSFLAKVAMASGESGNGKYKDVTESAKFVITYISGSANVSFQVGDIMDSGVAVEGEVVGEWKDCFKVACYDDGPCVCTVVSDWEVCSSSGCPDSCPDDDDE